MRMGKWLSALVVSVCVAGCDTANDEQETDAPGTQPEAAADAPAETAVAPVAERLERALRALDRGEDIAGAKVALEAILADKAVTTEQRDEAKLGLSRALSELGDEEGAIAAAEDVLASHWEDGKYPAREAAETRLRMLLVGKPEGSTYRLPRAKPLPPAAHALAKFFQPDAEGRVLVDMFLFGSPGRARSEAFEVAEAKREEASLTLSKNQWIGQSVSQSTSWTALPPAIAEKRADMPQADRSLLVFFYDLGDGRVPSRYDAYLPIPSEQIAAVLEQGQGLIAMRKRETGKPTFVIAAPRAGQLAIVEEAFSKLTELPAEPLKVPLPEGLMPEEIQARVRASFGSIRKCYEELLSRDKEAEGKFNIEFVIDAHGKVERATRGEESTLTDAKLETCILAGVRKLEFPAVGKSTTVKYPVVMSP